MIDIHSHILYDIPGDDGARDRSMSLDMLRQAAEAGTRELFATPHFHRRGICPSWDVITERLAQLQQAADDTGIPIRLHSGAEVSLDADTLNYLPGPGESRAYCLAGTAYLLVELLPTAAPLETWTLLNRKIRTAADVEQYLELPVLGVIPEAGNHKQPEEQGFWAGLRRKLWKK